MPLQHFACKLCSTNFPDSQTLLSHFLASHAAKTCKLCNRNNSTKAGNDFCEACKAGFSSEIAWIERADLDILKKSAELESYKHARASHFGKLRAEFLKHKAENFCEHNIPKLENCEKCNSNFEHKTRQTNKYVHIDLD